jgi:hypothetical protein
MAQQSARTTELQKQVMLFEMIILDLEEYFAFIQQMSDKHLVSGDENFAVT